MSCLHPTTMYPPIDDTRGARYVRDPRRAGGPAVEVACGQCAPCRKRLVMEWATRMMNEAKTSAAGQSWFVTCTFSPEAMRLRGTYSLSMREHQLFTKRLRDAFEVRKRVFDHPRQYARDMRKPSAWKVVSPPIRYGMCAEYGSMEDGKTGRPHYHYCFFNLPLDDRTPAAPSKSGLPQWHSAKLTEAWGQGLVWVGTVTPQSCQYVAGYIMKRATGEKAELVIRHWADAETGEVREDACHPEFGSSSRGGNGANGFQLGGLGSEWFRRNHMDCFPADFLWDRHTGRKAPVPRSYRRKLPEADRLAAGVRAMERSKQRDEQYLAAHRPPAPLRYPGLLDEGQRILLRRDVRTGVKPDATPDERQVAEGAARVLEMAEERVELSTVDTWQPYENGHREFAKRWAHRTGEVDLNDPAVVAYLGHDGRIYERVPSPAKQRDAALLAEHRHTVGRILNINQARKKRDL